MTISPMLAGWTRDVSGSAAALTDMSAAMMLIVIIFVGIYRLLQKT
jgi:hypothetical protein